MAAPLRPGPGETTVPGPKDNLTFAPPLPLNNINKPLSIKNPHTAHSVDIDAAGEDTREAPLSFKTPHTYNIMIVWISMRQVKTPARQNRRRKLRV